MKNNFRKNIYFILFIIFLFVPIGYFETKTGFLITFPLFYATENGFSFYLFDYFYYIFYLMCRISVLIILNWHIKKEYNSKTIFFLLMILDLVMSLMLYGHVYEDLNINAIILDSTYFLFYLFIIPLFIYYFFIYIFYFNKKK